MFYGLYLWNSSSIIIIKKTDNLDVIRIHKILKYPGWTFSDVSFTKS